MKTGETFALLAETNTNARRIAASFAFASLIFAVLGTSADLARASVVTIPSDGFQTIQSGIASGFDTILVTGSAPTNEHLVVDHPIRFLGAASPGSARCASLTIDQSLFPLSSWYGGVIRGFKVDGPTSIATIGPSPIEFHQYFDQCDFGGTIEEKGGIPFNGIISIRRSGLRGNVRMVHPNVVLDSCVANGVDLRVSATGDGGSWVRNCTITNAPDYGVWTGENTGDNWVLDNAIDYCPVGIRIGAPGMNRIRRNRITNCGVGITGAENFGSGFFLSVDQNVVLNSAGDGIAIGGYANGNTVVGSGGHGIVAIIPVDNLIAFNGGIGLITTQQGGCNLLWANAGDARSSKDVFADPMFCDMASGDLRVAANSPAVAGPCHQIGALGVGCSARNVVTVSDGASPAFGVRMTKNGLAFVSLAPGSTGRLDAFDVSGRRVSSTEVREGPTRVPLKEGMYFLRLTQGAKSVSTKAAIVE